MKNHNQHSHKEEHSQEHSHDHGGGHHEHMVKDFRRRFWVSIILTLPVLVFSPMIQSFLGIRSAFQFGGTLYVTFAFSLAVFVYGGYPFLKGFVDEIGKKQPGMMTLIALAITVAFVYSSAVVFGVPGRVFFWEVATLIDVMLLGHWVEMRSVMGASRALEELASLMPSEAHKLKENGETEDVTLDELNAGDKVLVKPGEKIPADGTIVEGESSVNEAMVTGESTPVTKKQDDEVIGGSVNGEGSLTVEVQKTGEDSFLSQVMNMVEEAQQSKSRTQNLADRAAFWLTVIALTAGVITLVTWLVLMQREFVFALERTVTVMVITCPHALGLAIPLVVAVSTAISARNGLLIRNRGPFERARNLQAIIFDKTGTLTKGTFEVTGVKTLSGQWGEKEVVRLAASVEQNSEHPIAKGIVEYADNKSRVSDFKAITGKGAQGKVDSQLVKVVSEGYLHENNMPVDDSQIEEVSGEGKTLAFVIIDDQPAGVIALSDVIRDESREAIRKLKDMGIQAMMLTGDNRKVAERVARELELDDYFAEVLPDDKADKVKEVQSRGLLVAMTGDGVNDAPALAQADIGIAIGAGTDVAVETADIILVKSNPMDAVHMIALSRATYRKMLQNLAWATGYNAIAIPLAAGVLYSFGILLSPAVGAVLMSLSTVIVAINARFLKYKETDKE